MKTYTHIPAMLYDIRPTYQMTARYQDAKAVRLAKLARRFAETTNNKSNTKTA